MSKTMRCYTSVISEDLLIKMVKGRIAKYVNEHYFDIDSKRNSYVFGALLSCYIPHARHSNGIIIRSRKRDLVELIRNELGSQHAITSDPRDKSSYWFQLMNQNLRSVLEKKGLGDGKKERRFPRDIEKENLYHFIRGFFDAKANVVNRKGPTCLMMGRFNGNKQFLSELNLILKKHAGVKRKMDYCKGLTYGSADSLKIYNLIYRDWKNIKESGLYLSSQKDKFDNIHNVRHSKRSMLIMEKIEKIKEHLSKGEMVKDFLNEVGYKSLVGLTHIFQKYTGQTVRAFRKHCVAESEIKIIERVKELLLQRKKTKEILDELGYSDHYLYPVFKRVTGQRLRDFKREIKNNIAV